MDYLLTKLLPLFVYPLGLTISLCLFGLLLLWAGRRGSAVFAVLLAVIVLWGASTPMVANSLVGSLERDYPPLQIEEFPSAEAIVILGGMTRGTVPGTELADLSGGVDRLLHGARLWKAGKAPLVILSGGNEEGCQPESEAMAEILKLMTIPEKVMFLESTSRNTYQNGLYTAAMLESMGISRILLVTSAYHMRRASAVFKDMGVSVIPAATDYQIVKRFPSILDWIPQAYALDTTTRGIKEYIGWWVYSFPGNSFIKRMEI